MPPTCGTETVPPSRGLPFMAAASSMWQGVTSTPSARIVRLLATLLALLSTVPVRAEPPARRSSSHDIELELHARRALQKDSTLAPYNLFVRVEQGVATVSGAVASRELARRAVQALKKVRDIHEVRDATRVETFEAEESLRSLLAGFERCPAVRRTAVLGLRPARG